MKRALKTRRTLPGRFFPTRQPLERLQLRRENKDVGVRDLQSAGKLLADCRRSIAVQHQGK